VVDGFDRDGTAGDEMHLVRAGHRVRASAGEAALSLEDDSLARVKRALPLLWDAWKLAWNAAEDPWEYSVDWPELQRAGLTCNEGRWLIQQGLATHAKEVTSTGDERRRFVSYASLNLSEQTCLVLTEEGCRLARQIGQSCAASSATGTDATAEVVSHERINGHAVDCGESGDNASSDGIVVATVAKPTWDRDRRQLRVGTRVVKEFKVPATNQEIILAVFEEEEWPAKIDDPLPRTPQIDPQRRLHDTINSLNRKSAPPAPPFRRRRIGPRRAMETDPKAPAQGVLIDVTDWPFEVSFPRRRSSLLSAAKNLGRMPTDARFFAPIRMTRGPGVRFARREYC